MLDAVYDLASSPPTFDFVGFLVSAELERIRLGEQHLRVLIAGGPDHGFRRDQLPPRDPAVRRKMLDNIVIPMCSLLPSCVVVEEWDADSIKSAKFPGGWTHKSHVSHYGTHHMVSAWKAGCFPLRVDVPISQRSLVTITLRESEYWPMRNSNYDAWMNLAVILRSCGMDVLIIRDNEMPNSADRARLYASAHLNLFVNNGPAWLATMMPQANCIIFKMVAAGCPCTNASFLAGAGFPIGSQVGRPGHRIVWSDDTEECLVKEVIGLFEKEAAYG